MITPIENADGFIAFKRKGDECTISTKFAAQNVQVGMMLKLERQVETSSFGGRVDDYDMRHTNNEIHLSTTIRGEHVTRAYAESCLEEFIDHVVAAGLIKMPLICKIHPRVIGSMH